MALTKDQTTRSANSDKGPARKLGHRQRGEHQRRLESVLAKEKEVVKNEKRQRVATAPTAISAT